MCGDTLSARSSSRTLIALRLVDALVGQRLLQLVVRLEQLAEAVELVLDAVELALGLDDVEEGLRVSCDELVGHQSVPPPFRSCSRPH